MPQKSGLHIKWINKSLSEELQYNLLHASLLFLRLGIYHVSIQPQQHDTFIIMAKEKYKKASLRKSIK